MDTIANRLVRFIKSKGLSTRQFEDSANLSNGAIFTALKTDEAFFEGKKDKPGGISSHNIAKILQTYPELSAEWLILGTGEMSQSEQQSQVVRKVEVDYSSEFKRINSKLDEILEFMSPRGDTVSK